MSSAARQQERWRFIQRFCLSLPFLRRTSLHLWSQENSCLWFVSFKNTIITHKRKVKSILLKNRETQVSIRVWRLWQKHFCYKTNPFNLIYSSSITQNVLYYSWSTNCERCALCKKLDIWLFFLMWWHILVHSFQFHIHLYNVKLVLKVVAQKLLLKMIVEQS